MANDENGRDGRFSQAQIRQRQVSELVGFSRGLIADGELNDMEIESLHRWLIANDAAAANPVVTLLIERIRTAYGDGYVDEDERADLLDTLRQFAGDNYETGEVLKPSTLPFTNPAPNLSITGQRFTLTGTFTLGTRSECERRITQLGGECGNLTKATDCLIIGGYATDSWKNSSFGLKIENAVALQQNGHPIVIVPEHHWRMFI